mgnify:CR=1 FL=1
MISPEHRDRHQVPFWKRLFSDTGFGWEFRMRPGDAESFFAPQDPGGKLLSERNSHLDDDLEAYCAMMPHGVALVEGAWDLALAWGHVAAPHRGARDLVGLTRQWEPDLLFLDHATLSVAAGCVCMPSSWDLRHAVGKSLQDVHDLVPRLNPQIGEQITRFLNRVQPGKAFCRENWSLTRSAELNYHPDLRRRRLDETVCLEEVFLRVEQQLFTGVPGGVLMGIRIATCPLADLAADHDVWRIVTEKIRTMPDDVAAYKRMDTAKGAIVRLMEAWG